MIGCKRRQGTDVGGSAGGGGGVAPGKRTWTQVRAGRGYGAASCEAGASALPGGPAIPTPHEDPFGMHLLGDVAGDSDASNAADGDDGPGDAAAGTGAASGAVPYGAELGAMLGESFADVQATTGDPDLAARGIRGAAAGETVRFANEAPAAPLVAHELPPVVQQRQADVSAPALSDAPPPSGAAEVETRMVRPQAEAGDMRPVTVSRIRGPGRAAPRPDSRQPRRPCRTATLRHAGRA